MGIGGISIAQLLIIFAIILLFFGRNRIRHLGEDLGTAIKGFKKAVSDPNEDTKKIDKNHADNQYTANSSDIPDNMKAKDDMKN